MPCGLFYAAVCIAWDGPCSRDSAPVCGARIREGRVVHARTCLALACGCGLRGDWRSRCVRGVSRGAGGWGIRLEVDDVPAMRATPVRARARGEPPAPTVHRAGPRQGPRVPSASRPCARARLRRRACRWHRVACGSHCAWAAGGVVSRRRQGSARARKHRGRSVVLCTKQRRIF